MGGACDTYGGEERFLWDFSGKCEENRSLGRPRSKWEDNIKIDLREIGLDVVGGLN